MGRRFSRIDTPWGAFLVGWSDRGIFRLYFPGKHPEVELSPPEGIALELGRELREYLQGKGKGFAVPLDLEGTPFQLSVWKELLRVPYGEMVTYGELARRMGKPRAARAVGRAVGANPVPIIIPCHRVIPKSGGIGNFGPGPEWKRKLLELEGVL